MNTSTHPHLEKKNDASLIAELLDALKKLSEQHAVVLDKAVRAGAYPHYPMNTFDYALEAIANAEQA